MRIRAFLPFFLLFLVSCCLVDARKDGGEYWKNMMKGEDMPKALKDLIGRGSGLDPSKIHTTRFVTEFDDEPSFIVYHGQAPTP